MRCADGAHTLRSPKSVMFTTAVVLSLLGLLISPALVAWTRGSRVAFAALDGATLAIIPGLVLLRLLPHLVEETGAFGLAACAGGYVLFWAIESRAHRRSTDIGVAIVLPALALHGFLDGAGLALAFQRSDLPAADTMAIGAALVFHKLPEGLFVSSVLLPTLGLRKTALRLLLLAAATLIGALSGRELLSHSPDHALHVLVALGLGVMLRMAIHRHGTALETRGERVASGVSFVGGLTLLLALPDPQRLFSRAQPGELTALEALAPLLLETAPWLLIALLLGEVVARWAPAGAKEHEAPTAMWLPMVALSLPLLGPAFTLVRAVVEPLCQPRSASENHPVADRPWQTHALMLASRAAPRADRALRSYVVAVVLAVALEAAVPGHSLSLGALALPFAVVLAILLRSGAAGTTVIAALLIHKGLSPSAALVFTGVAAYASAKVRPALSSRATIAAILTLTAAALVVGLVGLQGHIPPLHSLAVHRHTWTEWLAAAVITSWALLQLITAGPRRWFTGPRNPATHQVTSTASAVPQPRSA